MSHLAPSHTTHSLDAVNSQRLDAVLLDWSSWCDHPPMLLRELQGGLTNHSYLLESLGEYYVLRLNTDNADELDLDRGIESRVLMFAADAGITSPLVYVDPAEYYLVTKYIEGSHWQKEASSTAEGMGQLAGLLNAIHQLEPVERCLDVAYKANTYWRGIDDHSEHARLIKLIESKVQEHIVWAETNNTSPCLCHNDLLIENLIVDNQSRLYAIDWEYAAMGDPYFDLAVIIEGHGLSDTAATQFLHHYNDGPPTAHNVKRLYSNRVIYCYLSMLWYGVQEQHQPLLPNNKSFDEALNKLKKLLVHPL